MLYKFKKERNKIYTTASRYNVKLSLFLTLINSYRNIVKFGLISCLRGSLRDFNHDCCDLCVYGVAENTIYSFHSVAL